MVKCCVRAGEGGGEGWDSYFARVLEPPPPGV
jgi:hypothetical protein